MTQSEFLSSLLPLVQERLPEGLEISTRNIVKNNGTILTGLFLCPGDERGGSAIVYPEQFQSALSAGYSMEEIADEVVETLLTPVPSEMRELDFSDPEFLLQNVILKLVGGERNRDLRETVVNREWLDMLQIPALLVHGESCGSGLVLLTKEMLKESGLLEEEVFDFALKNTREKFGEIIRSVDQVLSSEVPDDVSELPREKLYVMSNRKCCLGASTLLYSEKLGKLSRMLGEDIFILPSSIHEIILVPAEDVSEEFLRTIINETNRIERRQEEILTDSLYRYLREKEEIILVS